MPESLDIWKLLAGLGIFLFGMFLMEESIKNLAGRSFKTFIRRSTNVRLKSILSGTLVTGVLQSSSAVSLMVLTFVGAGIMTMENAIGVILGSNLGTTFTSWIVAFFGFEISIEEYSLPLIGIGGLGLIFLGKSERFSNLSKLLVGFGFLFMGLDYMKSSVEQLTTDFDVTTLQDHGITVFAIAGIVLTAIMQSSSATIAIVLTSLNVGVLGFNAAAAMVIGANVGTTITVLLGSIGESQVKKRVALSHLTFNSVTAIIGLLLIPTLTWMIVKIAGPVEQNAVMGLALFHTIFNLVGVLIFLPFIASLSRLLLRAFPERTERLTKHLHHVTAEISEAGVEALRNETLHLAELVIRHNLTALHVESAKVLKTDSGKKQPVSIQYQNLKLLQSEIFSYASTILAGDVSKEESKLVNKLLHSARMALHSAKSIKDEIRNFEEFEASDNAFLREENESFRQRLVSIYNMIVIALITDDHDQIVDTIDKTVKKLTIDDKQFIKAITKATSEGQIKDIDISTALLVNRVFNQSSKQLIYGIKEILLTDREIELLETLGAQPPKASV